MAGGLVGLLDDIAALAKLAAASIDDVGAAAGRAGIKTAGVVIDDTAVTPARHSTTTTTSAAIASAASTVLNPASPATRWC